MRLRNQDIFLTNVEDSAVLLDTRLSNYITVNASGTLLLHKLAADCTLDDLVTALVDRFEIDNGAARADCEAFVEQLRAQDFLIE